VRALVAAAGGRCGLALLGPRILNHAKVRTQQSSTAANTGVCLIREPSRVTRFVARTGVSSVIAARTY
jgi:hypothetical protein